MLQFGGFQRSQFRIIADRQNHRTVIGKTDHQRPVRLQVMHARGMQAGATPQAAAFDCLRENLLRHRFIEPDFRLDRLHSSISKGVAAPANNNTVPYRCLSKRADKIFFAFGRLSFGATISSSFVSHN
ncbi:hypothetical protein SDC9_187435 [bioreactor metagenome]|uniref:Uncharacterized protein n=1 Tax=bioreactor metagenome TaxID=1076179 RepID=A0A645HLJ9_9ZZZZ